MGNWTVKGGVTDRWAQIVYSLSSAYEKIGHLN